MYPISAKKCPYCDNELEKEPAKKTRCKKCNHFYFVRTLVKDKSRVITTKEEADKINKEWDEYTFNKYKDKLGITLEEYAEEKKQLSFKFGGVALSNDVIWSLFNKKIARTTDRKALSDIYFGMASLVAEEGRRNPCQFLEQHHRMNLMNYIEDGDVFEEVQILAAPNSCDSCKSLNGKIFSIKDALSQMPLPNKECTFKLDPKHEHSWCRCTYVPKVKKIEVNNTQKIASGNPLLDWIQEVKDKKSETEIKDELIKRGWSLDEINNAVDVIYGRKQDLTLYQNKKSWSGLAGWTLFFGIMSMFLADFFIFQILAFCFGIPSLIRIGKNNEKGKVMAVIGLLLAALYLMVGAYNWIG